MKKISSWRLKNLKTSPVGRKILPTTGLHLKPGPFGDPTYIYLFLSMKRFEAKTQEEKLFFLKTNGITSSEISILISFHFLLRFLEPNTKPCFYPVPKLALYPQLLGRLFSPSDKCKKLSHHFFIAFFNWYGFLWPPRKISGCVSLAPRKHFFHKGPPF